MSGVMVSLPASRGSAALPVCVEELFESSPPLEAAFLPSESEIEHAARRLVQY